MFESQGQKKMFKQGHQRLESRHIIMVKTGHFTMFCPHWILQWDDLILHLNPDPLKRILKKGGLPVMEGVIFHLWKTSTEEAQSEEKL